MESEEDKSSLYFLMAMTAVMQGMLARTFNFQHCTQGVLSLKRTARSRVEECDKAVSHFSPDPLHQCNMIILLNFQW